MIPGAMLGLFIGRKCPEWIVYALGVALAIACRMVTGAWFLRFGHVPISGLSMTGILVCILNIILAYAFVWSGFRVSIVMLDRRKQLGERDILGKL